MMRFDACERNEHLSQSYIVKIREDQHVAFITIYHHLISINQAPLLFIVGTLFAVNVTSYVTGDNWKRKK